MGSVVQSDLNCPAKNSNQWDQEASQETKFCNVEKAVSQISANYFSTSGGIIIYNQHVYNILVGITLFTSVNVQFCPFLSFFLTLWGMGKIFYIVEIGRV